MIQPGTILGDRYEIIDHIGAGGMADVYKAKCHKLNRFVAIKVLKAEYSSNKNFVSKFRVEAQSAAGLMHPNIVNVYDVGEEDGMYYFVMELVEGITLKNYIEKKIRLSVKEAVSIAIQVAMGIEAAHNNGIIHRDIKPQNIIISKDGKVKVADFGIARAATSDTITSHAMGSVHYTSPEQARGGYSDAKSDIYSIGITMFEMVTGRVPFDGETTVAIAIKHIQEEMPSPRVYVPEIPVSVEQIIFKCTQKNPDRRYTNAADLIQDLKHSLMAPDENFVVISQGSNEGTKTISEDDRQNIRQKMNQDQMLSGNYSGKSQAAYAGRAASFEDNPVRNRPASYEDSPAGNRDSSMGERPPLRQQGYEDFGNSGRIGAYQDNRYNQNYNNEYDSYGQEYDEEDIEHIQMFSPRKSKVKSPTGPIEQPEAPVRNQQKARGRQVEAEEYVNPAPPEPYYDDFDDEDDVDPKMEKAMTILLVVAGIIILVVAVIVIGNVLGLFGKKAGGDATQVEQQSELSVVPDLVGKNYSEAEKLLTNAGLTASASREESREYDKDYIISQDIEPGTSVESGTQLKLVISSGKIQGNSVPDVVGKSEAEARVLLQEEGFVIEVHTVESGSVPIGNVVSQAPLGATTALRGSTVVVNVSGGEAVTLIKVPDLVGKDETTAKSMLTTAGLNWGTITEEHNSSVAAGLVLSQTVAADAEVDPGTTVNFIVSLGPAGYTCSYDIQAPADYLIGTEAIVVLSDLTNAEVGRYTTTAFPYTLVQNGLTTEMGYISVQYQGIDGAWHQTAPVAVSFTQG